VLAKGKMPIIVPEMSRGSGFQKCRAAPGSRNVARLRRSDAFAEPPRHSGKFVKTNVGADNNRYLQHGCGKQSGEWAKK
jgi:hypothetical protein